LWTSRDLSLVIFIVVLSFIYSLLIGQLGTLLTGIPGANFLFTVGHAIIISFALLIYEGKRWRFLMQGTLLALLFIPTYMSGTPFTVLPRIPIIINSLHGDLLFNSIYGFFKKQKMLLIFAIFVATEFLVMGPFFAILIWPLFTSPEVVSTFFNVTLMMLPVIIVESIIGAIIGFKIYERVKNLFRNQ
jgi:hypothetical protein